MKRSSLREQVFKILFRAEFMDGSEMEQQEELFFDSGDIIVSPKDREYIVNKVNRIVEKTPEIDAQLSGKMKGWTIERIGKVELALLRLGIYELEYDDDIPDGVAIAEAVELAMKFGSENSGSFVNGVLAKFTKD